MHALEVLVLMLRLVFVLSESDCFGQDLLESLGVDEVG
jgi:hypothetical protein